MGKRLFFEKVSLFQNLFQKHILNSLDSLFHPKSYAKVYETIASLIFLEIASFKMIIYLRL